MIQARDVRLVAQWRDDPAEARMTVDLRIFDERCASPWEVFGAFDLESTKSRPFVLRRDGRIDFGETHEPWRTDLRDAELRTGSEFSVWFNETDCGIFRIVKIAALGAKQET
jgi:hypothetical protein